MICRLIKNNVLLVPCFFALACGPPVVGELDQRAPGFGTSFLEHWGDGMAEIASYDLTISRYGEPRAGSAVAIVVKEPFSDLARVKSDRAEGAGVFEALKLNLVKDFPTGIYDYNMMLSAFVALETHMGLRPGEPSKVSFSSQEWCGHVYQQVLFDPEVVRHQSHSYFEGEADTAGTLVRPDGALTEDTLHLWARGLAAPALAPGESVHLPLLISLQRARLSHRELVWSDAQLSRSAGTSETTVPAGTFEGRTYRAEIEGGPTWTFVVEDAPPHRLLRWSGSDGESAELVASERLPYWQLNGNEHLPLLERIGLRPRPSRAP
jgi:hypothetical protein